MGYEVDFLAVGEESKSGDAIALRYGNLFGDRDEQQVVVIDGGFADSGAALVQHLRERYGTDRVNLAVASHADGDHVSGLVTLLTELYVDELWMHQPWKHSNAFAVQRSVAFRSAGYPTKVVRSFQQASTLEETAIKFKVPISEPFSGTTSKDGAIHVLGPTETFYEELLAEIRPEADLQTSGLTAAFRKAAEVLVNMVPESLQIETLTDAGHTFPQNNMSVISLLKVDDRKLLFTADAGIPALAQALDLLEDDGFVPGDPHFVQVPHHGSRRNVGPTVLGRLLGPKGNDQVLGTAFVSAARKGAPKHPAKKVLNAFRRRGYPVCATQGKSLWHGADAPPREGYFACDPLPLYELVEDDSS